SFHGGAGGVAVRPTAAEMAVEHERHIGVTAMQRQHEQMARSDKSLRAAVNGGRPAIAATPRPAVFSGHGVIAARGASPAGQRTDRPRQTQRPALAEHSGGPRVDRPPQALRPAAPRPLRHREPSTREPSTREPSTREPNTRKPNTRPPSASSANADINGPSAHTARIFLSQSTESPADSCHP